MALRLGEILLEKKLITQEQLKDAVEEQKKTGEFLGLILVKLGMASESAILRVLADQQGIRFVDLKSMKIDEKTIKSVPAKFAWHYKIMPVSVAGKALTIAVSNPFDMWPIDDLETHLGFRAEKILATASDIMEAIKKYYGIGSDTIEQLLFDESRTGRNKAAEPKAENAVEDLEKMSGTASVVTLVNQVLQQAIADRATDIHLERFRDEVILRYRIDGILYDIQSGENIRFLYPAIVSRIKVMSRLDIIERRIPQDGRAKVKIGGNEYDMRVSIVPTIYGEGIVIRVLSDKMLFSISDLGMSGNEIGILEKLIQKPHGIIFVTGPTGSGKSTTLYTCLSRMNTRDKKIITIEDPVEYELRGVSQIQVHPKIGLTFANILRSTLRHDPDIMMVGEVRDLETAQIAIQTALTGHLVFSTLHTNDAVSSITRLLDIGVEPYLVASSAEAFVAQRLVRLLCDHCKEPQPCQGLDATLRSIPEAERPKTIFRGKGCKACNQTGYLGRTGIYEILVVDEEIRRLVIQKAPADAIKLKVLKKGMRTLNQNGWEKVSKGITSPEEIMRVTQVEM